jgi:hypothetical protein
VTVLRGRPGGGRELPGRRAVGAGRQPRPPRGRERRIEVEGYLPQGFVFTPPAPRPARDRKRRSPRKRRSGRGRSRSTPSRPTRTTSTLPAGPLRRPGAARGSSHLSEPNREARLAEEALGPHPRPAARDPAQPVAPRLRPAGDRRHLRAGHPQRRHRLAAAERLRADLVPRREQVARLEAQARAPRPAARGRGRAAAGGGPWRADRASGRRPARGADEAGLRAISNRYSAGLFAEARAAGRIEESSARGAPAGPRRLGRRGADRNHRGLQRYLEAFPQGASSRRPGAVATSSSARAGSPAPEARAAARRWASTRSPPG